MLRDIFSTKDQDPDIGVLKTMKKLRYKLDNRSSLIKSFVKPFTKTKTAFAFGKMYTSSGK